MAAISSRYRPSRSSSAGVVAVVGERLACLAVMVAMRKTTAWAGCFPLERARDRRLTSPPARCGSRRALGHTDAGPGGGGAAGGRRGRRPGRRWPSGGVLARLDVVGDAKGRGRGDGEAHAGTGAKAASG